MEEDRHLDGRVVIAGACAVASLLVVVVDVATSVFFCAFGLIFAGASVIAVEEPASPRTRRLAWAAGLTSAVVLAFALLLLLTARQSGE